MLWASDATWVAMYVDEEYLDLHWTWVKDLASLVVPVDDRDDSKTMLWD